MLYEYTLSAKREGFYNITNQRSVAVSKGDTLPIQLRERHKVSFTPNEPACIWLCVFY